jgi:apolipoprotein N-acyltransferase
LAFYFAIFGYYAAYFFFPPGETIEIRMARRLKSIFFIPAFWVMLEYVRGSAIGGLPWALAGYSQWQNTAFIQAADLMGAYGISFFVLLVNMILFRLLKVLFSRDRIPAAAMGLESGAARKYPWILAGLLTGILVIFYVYGFSTLFLRDRFYKNPAIPKISLKISAIQGNIPQDQKWDARIKSIIFEKYKRLELMAANDEPDLIVWPETSFPGYLEEEPVMSARLRNLVRQSKASALIGAPTLGELEEGLRFYNSEVFYNAAGEEAGKYHKIHLVPFAEYIPWETAFGFLRNFFGIGHFSAGKEKTIFKVKSRTENISANFGVLICFEDIFPGLVRDFCLRGADFMVNITNDAWFGNTQAPYQHAQASVFRAVENRVHVVRATNTGFSCFISPEGRILSTVHDQKGREIMVTGHRTQEIILQRTRSFYTRFGDLFFWIVLILLVFAFRERAAQNKYAHL